MNKTQTFEFLKDLILNAQFKSKAEQEEYWHKLKRILHQKLEGVKYKILATMMKTYNLKCTIVDT